MFAYCINATKVDIKKANIKDNKANGIVTVMPSSNILGNELKIISIILSDIFKSYYFTRQLKL